MKKEFLLIVTLFAIVLSTNLLVSCGNTHGIGDGEDTATANNEVVGDVDTSDSDALNSDNGDANTGNSAERSNPVRVGAIKGPSAMGMALLLEDSAYDFTLASSPDEIVPMIVQGQLDIIAVPPSLASILYTRNHQEIQVLSVNTLGSFYIIENGDTIHSMEDLQGKTIYTAGKSGPPEYTLNSILKANGLDPATDVTIEFKSEHVEVVGALANNSDAVGMLPQPFATVALNQNTDFRIALDINRVWEESQTDGSRLITGVTIVRKEFLEANPEAVQDFWNHYTESITFVNSDPAAAAVIIGSHDIVAEAIAVQAIPLANIVFLYGAEMKTILSSYLNTLYEQDPEIVGGALPDDGFYFMGASPP